MWKDDIKPMHSGSRRGAVSMSSMNIKISDVPTVVRKATFIAALNAYFVEYITARYESGNTEEAEKIKEKLLKLIAATHSHVGKKWKYFQMTTDVVKVSNGLSYQMKLKIEKTLKLEITVSEVFGKLIRISASSAEPNYDFLKEIYEFCKRV